MVRALTSKEAGPRVALTLTILAIILKLMVPPGFMIADTGAAIPITICTGHGPLIINSDAAKAPKAPARKTDAPCAGAGNVTPPGPPLGVILPEPFLWAAPVLGAGLVLDIAPGRAAPPPPSHAPPHRPS